MKEIYVYGSHQFDLIEFFPLSLTTHRDCTEEIFSVQAKSYLKLFIVSFALLNLHNKISIKVCYS